MSGTSKKDIVVTAGILALMILIFLSVLGKKQPWVPGLDEANLIIHESGHVFFAAGGELIGALGGTIMQLLIPAAAILYFLVKKDRFATNFGVFWFGQNLLNISVYIKDARTMILPLVNGGYHDWNKILKMTNMLRMDGFLGTVVALTGYLLMFATIGYGGYFLFDKLKQRAAQPLI